MYDSLCSAPLRLVSHWSWVGNSERRWKQFLNIFWCCFVEKFIFKGKPIRMERALCPLRTEHNSIVTSVAIHCSFFSASFKLHLLCHKKMCSVLVSPSEKRRAKISAESWGRQRTIEERCCREGQIVFLRHGNERKTEPNGYQRRADMPNWGKDAWSSWECTPANCHRSSVSLCQDWMCFGVWRSSCVYSL